MQSLLIQVWHREKEGTVLREEWRGLGRDSKRHPPRHLNSYFSKERTVFGKSKALAKEHTSNKQQS